MPQILQSYRTGRVRSFPIDIRSYLYWFVHPLLIDFSCPACYVITRNPENVPVSDPRGAH